MTSPLQNKLHVTNGDCAAELITQTGLSGEILAWRDMLHEGSVPANLSSAQLREIRARFIADFVWWTNYQETIEIFTHRDNTVENFRQYEEIILWFEHDLYDQLQLIQILDRFSQWDLGQTKLSLICIDRFDGIEFFKGLGQLNSSQMASLYPRRQEISSAELTLATAAWQSFCANAPRAIEKLLATDTSALPFLANALLRHLEQFPSATNGLSRTEKQILAAVRSGARNPVEIFVAEQQQEASPFMGDSTIWSYLDRLCNSQENLLEVSGGNFFAFPEQCQNREEFLAQQLRLTDRGISVLQGNDDWIELNGIDRHLGGVHLNDDSHWRWHDRDRRLVLNTR